MERFEVHCRKLNQFTALRILGPCGRIVKSVMRFILIYLNYSITILYITHASICPVGLGSKR